jgi:hypothetical protein
VPIRVIRGDEGLIDLRDLGGLGVRHPAVSPSAARFGDPALQSQLLGNSACVVAGLAEAGPGSATPATSFLPSEAKRVLPWGMHDPG